MRLEGTLDAFGLPDIFQLLSFTKKTGTLHLRREADHGVVHLREGAVTGARSDVRRQALARRLVGAGLVDDDLLARTADGVSDRPAEGLAQAMAAAAGLDGVLLSELAAEQATDAVFDLLRWTEGEFAFVMDEPDPDDLGAALPVDTVVTEARRRLADWPALTAAVPAPDAVVSLAPVPAAEITLRPEEWQLVGLVDGCRTVADLVALSGRGDFAVVSALAGLGGRGLLVVGAGTAPMSRRQALLAALEDLPGSEPPSSPAAPAPAAPAPAPAPAALAPAPSQRTAPGPVLPSRPEPFLPVRRPDFPQEAARPTLSLAGRSESVGVVHGATAMALDPLAELSAVPVLERDPAINRSLLLRLIAGVRGL